MDMVTSEILKGMAQLLLARGANINAKDKSGRTPLKLAVGRNYEELAQYLRLHGGKE